MKYKLNASPFMQIKPATAIYSQTAVAKAAGYNK